ncbi:MAG TPA: FecR domain-containing protein, partial [Rhodocyclaceae bacterium]|nr:FecR domain-containing protein [Rhodocyclaceae bacterium]
MAACAIAFAGAAHAACDQPAGRLAAIEGLVEVRAGVHGPWQPAGLRQMLCPGDQVAVRGPGRAAIALAQDVLVRLDQNTTLTLPGSPTRADTELGLTGGVVHVISRFRKRLGVLTPVVNALVDGTEFVVADGDGRARVSVAEGHVRAVTGAGELSLGAGEATDVADGAAPGPALVVSPLDAVRWAIHYPQVARPPADALAADPVLRTAVSLAEAGRFRAALDTLGDGGPPAFRAALFLGLGRADEARGVLSAATPEAGVAAVRAVIQVARNDAEALATARDAVRSDPASAPARLALSYALQADRQVPAALAAAESATALRPDDPVAWARRAELELALSRLAAGRESARRALALNPAVPRARALAAFAELLAGRTEAAAEAFDALLADDGSEPLAHLGRALAHLRQGEVAAGRQELEVAVLLDPSNAELRSALGRAYLEEDRDKVAGDQFELARRLDPASPTPWYFDAFRKLRNRDFLAAVADGEEAVARNESRGVLRSGELLDQDRAARSASLGEAYREVGFYGPMQARAMDALADDPQSPAAHRLLADAYAGVPRFETARVSELLQAELRQPIGQMPLPPQFVMPALPVLDGPRALSPDESTGLFARKPDHFAFSALGGNQDTGAASLVAAHAWERGQIGVGAFDYRSRALVAGDADTHLSGTRLTGQFALTPASSVFAELRHTERVSGDQTLSLFDADLKRLRD